MSFKEDYHGPENNGGPLPGSFFDAMDHGEVRETTSKEANDVKKDVIDTKIGQLADPIKRIDVKIKWEWFPSDWEVDHKRGKLIIEDMELDVEEDLVFEEWEATKRVTIAWKEFMIKVIVDWSWEAEASLYDESSVEFAECCLIDTLKKMSYETELSGNVITQGMKWKLYVAGNEMQIIQYGRWWRPKWLTGQLQITNQKVRVVDWKVTIALLIEWNVVDVTFDEQPDGTVITTVSPSDIPAEDVLNTEDSYYSNQSGVPSKVTPTETVLPTNTQKEHWSQFWVIKVDTSNDQIKRLPKGNRIWFNWIKRKAFSKTLYAESGDKLSTRRRVRFDEGVLKVEETQRLDTDQFTLDLTRLGDGQYHEYRARSGIIWKVRMQAANGILAPIVSDETMAVIRSLEDDGKWFDEQERQRNTKSPNKSEQTEAEDSSPVKPVVVPTPMPNDTVPEQWTPKWTPEVIEEIQNWWKEVVLWSEETGSFIVAKTKEQYERAVASLSQWFEEEFVESDEDDLDEFAVEVADNYMITSFSEKVLPLEGSTDSSVDGVSLKQWVWVNEYTVEFDTWNGTTAKVATMRIDDHEVTMIPADGWPSTTHEMWDIVSMETALAGSSLKHSWKLKFFPIQENDWGFKLHLWVDVPDDMKMVAPESKEKVAQSLQWPVDLQKVNSPYWMRTRPDGSRKMHNGVDIPVKHAQVRAAQDWVVLKVKTDWKGLKRWYWRYLYIQHEINGKKYITLYAHMKNWSINVKAGQKVTAGQSIGISWNTWWVRWRNGWYHLHFEVREATSNSSTNLNTWKPVNPMEFFDFDWGKTKTQSKPDKKKKTEIPQQTNTNWHTKNTLSPQLIRDLDYIDIPWKLDISMQFDGYPIERETIVAVNSKIRNEKGKKVLSNYRFLYDKNTWWYTINDLQWNVLLVVNEYHNKLAPNWVYKKRLGRKYQPFMESNTITIKLEWTQYNFQLEWKNNWHRNELYCKMWK